VEWWPVIIWVMCGGGWIEVGLHGGSLYCEGGLDLLTLFFGL